HHDKYWMQKTTSRNYVFSPYQIPLLLRFIITLAIFLTLTIQTRGMASLVYINPNYLHRCGLSEKNFKKEVENTISNNHSFCKNRKILTINKELEIRQKVLKVTNLAQNHPLLGKLCLKNTQKINTFENII